MPPVKIELLTIASSEVGLGHLNRCLALLQSVKTSGASAHLTIDADPGFLQHLAPHPDVTVADGRTQIETECDLCVVDRYEYSEEFYLALRRQCARIVVFDDSHKALPAHVSGVINPNLVVRKDAYPFGVKVFGGAEYVLVQDAFAGVRRVSNASRLFVCTGGSDPECRMNDMLNAALAGSSREVDAVFGPAFAHLEAIDRWSEIDRVTVHHNPPNLPEIMTQACFSLTSMGSMAYELASLGIPQIGIALAENQVPIAEALDQASAAHFLGYHRTVTQDDMIRIIASLDSDPKALDAMAENASKLIFPGGADRLAADLLSWVMQVDNPAVGVFSESDIREEYAQSALNETEEHRQLRWGSREGMVNRYQMALQESGITSGMAWIDIGSGTGAFQEYLTRCVPGVRCTGVEISEDLYRIAIARNLAGTQFFRTSFDQFEQQGFDRLTCLGVLSKTNLGVSEFIHKAANVLNAGCLVIVDFKNAEWERFSTDKFFPDVRHRWFRQDDFIELVVRDGRFRIVKVFGFDPATGRYVKPSESHTIVVVAQRVEREPRPDSAVGKGAVRHGH